MAGLTLRYTYEGPPPEDPWTTLYCITDIPLVNCTNSGKYIIATLANQEHYDEQISPAITRKLKNNGFTLVESQETRSAKTILAFRPPREITELPLDHLHKEIEKLNEVEIEEIYLMKARSVCTR